MSVSRISAAALFSSALLMGAAVAQEKSTIRVTQIVNDTAHYSTKWTAPFAKAVEQITDGAVSLQLFPVGVVAPPFEAYAAVSDGLVDAVHATPLYIVNENPANTFFAGHPGGMNPEMLMSWIYTGGGIELLREMRREMRGMHSIPLGVGPAEVWHSHTQITTAQDLKGLKFRTSGAWAEILTDYFEAAPMAVPGSEVYTLLERKGIDVAEWSTPSENVLVGLQNAAPYIIGPAPHSNAFMFELMVRAEVWDALPEDVQAKVEAAARLVTFDGYLSWVADDVKAIARLNESGTPILRMTSELNEAVKQAGYDWAYKKAAEEEEKGNSYMRRIADSYYEFMENWDKNSIYNYDDQ